MARVFVYDGRTFPDPDPSLSVDDVRRQLSDFFPELANADVNQSTQGDNTVHTFARRIGTKGAEPVDQNANESYRKHARASRDYQWHFTERVAELGTLWFTPWEKNRRPQGPDEWRDGLLTGMDIVRWYSQHPDWFVVGEWDNDRAARPISITDAGRAALANRAQYDMEPYAGGMIEPGWVAVPTPSVPR